MSFWSLNDTNEKLDTSGEFESGGSIEPIPNNTQVKAAPDEAKMDAYEGDEYISIRWNVLAPEQYKGRKIFQKVRVFDSDSKKQDKAKKMLAAIASNAGGGLLKEDDPCHDMALQKHLLNKPMALKLQVWKLKSDDGEEKTGNWVSAVAPVKKKQAAKPEPQPEPDFDDDDVGF